MLTGLQRMLLLILVCCSIAPLKAAAEADALTNISGRIGHYQTVRAGFTQTKHMAALKRPLITSGRMFYSRSNGVLWLLERPYQVSYVLGEEKITEIAPDQSRKERGLREMPGLGQIGRIFRALLSADIGALQEYFDISVEGDTGKWTIRLKPRQTQLAQFLSGLELSGGRFVEAIHIAETSGDTTDISFRNMQDASALTTAELLLFNGESRTPAKP